MVGLEISDVIVRLDGKGRARVARADAMAALAGDPWGRAIIARMPVDDAGLLDDDAVDRELVRAHRELQRLNEEFQQGERLLRVLRPLLACTGERARVVDLGCGIGFVVRWLAAHAGLPPEVELVGCDFNPALLEEARRAARADGLDRARFLLDDAFALETPADIITSTGVIHHFAADDLEGFFAAHADTVGFAHYDIEQSFVTPIGSALFHVARMRSALARHDGIWSARRAHSVATLVDAARRALPDFAVGVFDRHRGLFPVTRVLRPIIGVRREHEDALRAALGPRWEVA